MEYRCPKIVPRKAIQLRLTAKENIKEYLFYLMEVANENVFTTVCEFGVFNYDWSLPEVGHSHWRIHVYLDKSKLGYERIFVC